MHGRTLGAFLSAYQSKYELAFLHYTTPGLIVNINGDSIGNITKNNHPMLAAALENPDNGETFYYVFDEASRMRTKECIEVGNGLTYGVSYEPLFETGEAVHYDSLEAAAEALNLPNLVQTIETNNEHSRKGEEDESGRANLPLIDDRDGVYLLRVIPTYYLTTGGLGRRHGRPHPAGGRLGYSRPLWRGRRAGRARGEGRQVLWHGL